MTTQSKDDLLGLEFSRFYNSTVFSDLTLRYANGLRTARVHKIVLCTQSSWFAKACEGPFREASQATIELFDDEHPDAVDSMLKWCYGVWPDVTPGSSSRSSRIEKGKEQDAERIAESIRHSAYVYAVADKYDIGALRERMLEEFRRDVKENWMDLWGQGLLPGVINAAYEYAVDTATNPLCAVLLEGVSRHLGQLREQNERRLRALLDECPDLATDLVLRLAIGGALVQNQDGDAWGRGSDSVVQDEEARTPMQDEGAIFPVVPVHVNANAVGAGMRLHFRAFCGIRA